MSYQAASALQQSVYTALTQNGELYSGFNGHIFDAPPDEETPDKYVLIGEEIVTDKSSHGSKSAQHDFTVTLNSRESGFSTIKKLAEVVCDVLTEPTLPIDRGSISRIDFRSARAKRGQNLQRRQIILTFRALIDEI